MLPVVWIAGERSAGQVAGVEGHDDRCVLDCWWRGVFVALAV